MILMSTYSIGFTVIGNIHHNEKVIAYLSEEVDGLSHAVKNLDKHSRMIETQCSQISETQSLMLAQHDNDNLVSYNWIGT